MRKFTNFGKIYILEDKNKNIKNMAIKFSHAFTKGDVVKISILLIVASICWVVVWREYQKPYDIHWVQPNVVKAKR